MYARSELTALVAIAFSIGRRVATHEVDQLCSSVILRLARIVRHTTTRTNHEEELQKQELLCSHVLIKSKKTWW